MKEYNQETYNNTDIPLEYGKIFNDINFETQKNKGVSDREISLISKRGYFLTRLAANHNVSNIIEVGTAAGWQFYSFCHYINTELFGKGNIWSCDVRDYRDSNYINKYPEISNFVEGDSRKMSKLIPDNFKCDLFFIDGNHDRGAVVEDINNLKKFQSENPIWVFDDYDQRFGIYEEIKNIESKAKVSSVISPNSINQSIEEKPNHMLITWGEI